jgi:hypothetical protein
LLSPVARSPVMSLLCHFAKLRRSFSDASNTYRREIFSSIFASSSPCTSLFHPIRMGSREISKALKRSLSTECQSPFKRRNQILIDYTSYLPREILEMILKYLQDDLDVIQTIRLVCKRWRNITSTLQISWNYMRYPSNTSKAHHLVNLSRLVRRIPLKSYRYSL